MTRVLRTVAEVRAWRGDAARVALVPTMGALHEGHLSLVDAARLAADAVVVSIFVNPTQFGPREDLAAYPRDEAGDLRLLEAHGADVAFVPAVEEMYPPGDETRVHPGPIAAPLEGAARPGHFVGVATVVAKLFAIVEPHVAFFGQKDFQQLRVLQTLARDLRFRTAVRGLPIVRAPDGVALSSRNRYLSPEERAAATVLSRALTAARERYERGDHDGRMLRTAVAELLATEPLCRVDYVSAADPETLAELKGPADRIVISVAARFGKARLIDNVLLGTDVSAL